MHLSEQQTQEFREVCDDVAFDSPELFAGCSDKQLLDNGFKLGWVLKIRRILESKIADVMGRKSDSESDDDDSESDDDDDESDDDEKSEVPKTTIKLNDNGGFSVYRKDGTLIGTTHELMC